MNEHKAAFALALLSHSKLGGEKQSPSRRRRAARRSPACGPQQRCRASSGGAISHRRCSLGDQLKAVAGPSGCVHLGAVLAGWQVGILVLLASLQVMEVWVGQGTVGRYSFGWIKGQALQK